MLRHTVFLLRQALMSIVDYLERASFVTSIQESSTLNSANESMCEEGVKSYQTLQIFVFTKLCGLPTRRIHTDTV